MQELTKFGVRNVFGYPGGNITYVIDAISTSKDVRYIQTYHEQGAAFAANGYAQANDSLGVAIASSGPGALNLITGVANAYFDSIPTLFISGDLSKRYEKCGLPLRQDGFQSTDIISIVRPITKYAEQVRAPEDIRYCLERAIYEAMHGRRGSTYLSIPHWVQKAEIEPSSLRAFSPKETEPAAVLNALLERTQDAITNSRRPLMLLGGGASNPETKAALIRFLECNPIPVVASLCGLNVLSHDHPSYVGFIGDYGHRHANIAVAASDCLIVLGSRIDERQIGVQEGFLTNKTIIHFDIDPSELLSESEHYIPIADSVLSFLNQMKSTLFNALDCSDWMKTLAELQIKYPVLPAGEAFTVNGFLRKFSELILPDSLIYVDVGLHQMAAAQGLSLTDDKKLFVTGGLGSMGYALPASIGGLFATHGRQIICITGDGGFMINLQELQIITRENINVKIVVINNNCLGMIREFQNHTFDGRSFGSKEGYQVCDIEKIAATYGLRFVRIACHNDQRLLNDALNYAGPALIEVVFPLDMQPFPAGFHYSLNDDVDSINNVELTK